MNCPVCGGEGECHPSAQGGKMGDIDFLSVDDWKQIYGFMRDVQMPFMHKIIARAAARKGIDFSEWRRQKRELPRIKRKSK